MTKQVYFTGSYLQGDVRLLLDVITQQQVLHIQPQQKEALIQSGKQHYSDMLTLENAPSPFHQQCYQQALQQGQQRMATDIAKLARSLHGIFTAKITAEYPLILVSLVRAGLPIGVLLQRVMNDHSIYHLPSIHYGISILRGRGIDQSALQDILIKHPNSPIVFIDGWTGKGAIYQELKSSLIHFMEQKSQHLPQIFHQGNDTIPLVTLSDSAGVAWLSASDDDWLIPSGLLNATVSGLISRTLYAPPEQGFHRCVFYQDLQKFDHSLNFVEIIMNHINNLNLENIPHLTPKQQPSFHTKAVIAKLAKWFDIDNDNRIKPTIAEATRAVLRRDPECVLIHPNAHPNDTALLQYLCQQRQIQVLFEEEIFPYTAVTIIKKRN